MRHVPCIENVQGDMRPCLRLCMSHLLVMCNRNHTCLVSSLFSVLVERLVSVVVKCVVKDQHHPHMHLHILYSSVFSASVIHHEKFSMILRDIYAPEEISSLTTTAEGRAGSSNFAPAKFQDIGEAHAAHAPEYNVSTLSHGSSQSIFIRHE